MGKLEGQGTSRFVADAMQRKHWQTAQFDLFSSVGLYGHVAHKGVVSP